MHDSAGDDSGEEGEAEQEEDKNEGSGSRGANIIYNQEELEDEQDEMNNSGPN